MTPPHRVHVLPWLRPLGGRLLIANWLAITIGRDVWSWRPLDEAELAHELCHVEQWQRHGAMFVVSYALASLVALSSGRHWYRDNAFEVAARLAAARVTAAPDAGRQARNPDQPSVGNQARSLGKSTASSSAERSARQTSG